MTVDVTTLIGAEEYLTSRNDHRGSGDPFARDCFVETVQTLIFNTNVRVAHPVLTDPRAVDFGERPYLLRSLLARQLIRPLKLTVEQTHRLAAAQQDIVRNLELDGVNLLLDYIEHTRTCDAAPGTTTIADRIKAWSTFQNRNVRNAAHHHPARIPTRDGIEEDEIGAWARATAASIRGRLGSICPAGDEAHTVAFLTRGLKYQALAHAGSSSYQPHTARRDFTVSFQFNASNADRERVGDVIKMVRGIHDTLLVSADDRMRSRVQLLAFELPLMGGRLWSDEETGKRRDRDWIDLVVDRIADYKDRSAELRAMVARCVFEEDHARIARDIDEVRYQLLERLGLRDVQLSPVERDLMEAASVAESAPGVPKVSALLLGPLTAGKRITFRGNPYQQFLYREFVAAWKRTVQ